MEAKTLSTKTFKPDGTLLLFGEKLFVGCYVESTLGFSDGNTKVSISTVVEADAESVIWEDGNTRVRCFFDGRMSVGV